MLNLVGPVVSSLLDICANLSVCWIYVLICCVLSCTCFIYVVIWYIFIVIWLNPLIDSSWSSLNVMFHIYNALHNGTGDTVYTFLLSQVLTSVRLEVPAHASSVWLCILPVPGVLKRCGALLCLTLHVCFRFNNKVELKSYWKRFE